MLVQVRVMAQGLFAAGARAERARMRQVRELVQEAMSFPAKVLAPRCLLVHRKLKQQARQMILPQHVMYPLIERIHQPME